MQYVMLLNHILPAFWGLVYIKCLLIGDYKLIDGLLVQVALG